MNIFARGLWCLLTLSVVEKAGADGEKREETTSLSSPCPDGGMVSRSPFAGQASDAPSRAVQTVGSVNILLLSVD